MDQDKLKNIISEEVNRVLEQEVARHELSLLESKFRDVSNKFKDALDRLPDRAFTTKNIEKLIKKLKDYFFCNHLHARYHTFLTYFPKKVTYCHI